jgi:hypothetical protein
LTPKRRFFTGASSDLPRVWIVSSDNPQLSYTPRRRVRRALGWIGVAVSMPVLAWSILGFLPGLPSIVDVFGIQGLRTPAAVTIAGLMLAAFGFHDP